MKSFFKVFKGGDAIILPIFTAQKICSFGFPTSQQGGGITSQSPFLRLNYLIVLLHPKLEVVPTTEISGESMWVETPHMLDMNY